MQNNISYRDTTNIMTCVGDHKPIDLELEREEMQNAHEQNIYMRGAVDALTGLASLLKNEDESDPLVIFDSIIDRAEHTPGDFAELCVANKMDIDE